MKTLKSQSDGRKPGNAAKRSQARKKKKIQHIKNDISGGYIGETYSLNYASLPEIMDILDYIDGEQKNIKVWSEWRTKIERRSDMYICRDCGQAYEEDEMLIDDSPVGEYLGETVYEEIGSCPHCGGGGFEEATECECGNPKRYLDDLCDGCKEDAVTRFRDDFTAVQRTYILDNFVEEVEEQEEN